MNFQYIITMAIVAVAAVMLVRHYFGGKKAKSPACGSCECGEEDGGTHPAHPEDSTNHRSSIND